MKVLCKLKGHFYVLKGANSGINYAIYQKYKNRAFVLQKKQELEQEHNEPINLFVD